MTDRRPSTQQMRNALKLATKSALFAAGGAAAVVREKMTRIGEAALSFCTNTDDPDHEKRFVGVDVALDLDFIAGEPIHARALAEMQGYRLERIEEPVSGEPVCLRAIARLSRAKVEAKTCLLDIIEDGHISRDEAVLADARLADLIREIEELRASLRGAM